MPPETPHVRSSPSPLQGPGKLCSPPEKTSRRTRENSCTRRTYEAFHYGALNSLNVSERFLYCRWTTPIVQAAEVARSLRVTSAPPVPAESGVGSNRAAAVPRVATHQTTIQHCRGQRRGSTPRAHLRRLGPTARPASVRICARSR